MYHFFGYSLQGDCHLIEVLNSHSQKSSSTENSLVAHKLTPLFNQC